MQKFKNMLISLENNKLLALLCLGIIVALAVFIHTRLWIYNTAKVGQEEDIYYIWLEGKRLLLSQNPYERILSGNLRVNQKYATYFPLFYIMSYLTQLLGLKDYPDWLFFWRHIFLIFNLGIASIIFYSLYRYNLILIAIFSAAFWLFNRWTLYVTTVAQIDFLPIFFLIVSLLIFRRYKWFSLLLFSLSLALKQIAIFTIPLYLIWIWKSIDRDRIKTLLIALAVIVSIPLLTALPFLFWNAEGFLKSVAFSATRNAETHFRALSLDAYIQRGLPNFVGIKAKLPMLLLMALIYISNLRYHVGMYLSSLLIMVVFIDFNSVLFTQYMCWVVPFIPLSVCDKMPINNQSMTS